MKKIDLHIHTVAKQNKDAHFDFDMDKLKEYVEFMSLDAIAITNHNLFDLEQFNEILSQVTNVAIFPGIEIDFEDGHLLLIADSDNLEDFNEKCGLVTTEVDSQRKLSVEKLNEIFVDLNNYLLIPHYTKSPKVSQNIINSLSDYIFTGEVQSPKTFYRTIKEENVIVPVLFSDLRMNAELNVSENQGRSTFIKTNSSPLTFSSVKTALRDKNKVFLSGSGKEGFFQIFSNGQELSNGLNVILGGRSSGKSHILDKLNEIYDVEEKSVKYIEQFELVQADKDEFNKRVENERSAIREEYLKEFRNVVDVVVEIDRYATDHSLDRYIKTLVEFASNESILDQYSKAKLFKENGYQIRKIEEDELEGLINAVLQLLTNENYGVTITKYISKANQKALFNELSSKYKSLLETRIKKEWVNEIVSEVRDRLESQTASPRIEDGAIDIYNIKLEREKIRKFNAIGKAVKKEVKIRDTDTFGKFKIRAVATKFTGANGLHKESGRQIAFSEAFKKYKSPISFLEELKKLIGLDKSQLYKYFCKVNYSVLNQYDKKVSGGEMAEFNLLRVLHDARQYDMLLIDEPESSFDNLFLKENVNKDIKNLSTEMPVVVVTHNNTVGMLLEPDYILFTKREIIDGNDEYKVFSGTLGDKDLKSADNSESISAYQTLLNTMEAGDDAYQRRASLYKNLKH